MHNRTDIRLKPAITINAGDYKRLAELALAAARLAVQSEALLLKLDRGHVVVDSDLENIVRMGSIVRYKTDTGDTRTITLVFPRDADISAGKVSVLTPIGTALLGLSAGQSATWTDHNSRKHELIVLSVGQAPPASSTHRGSDDPRHAILSGA
ncbi:nucleoside diphosphate kinase regulator [Sinorhizobium sp. BJ1]|uniref:nucleoside diphosphate kinase regulator n=1 Tax=Sinorhizobium sp. BJ1 TaxID=2035455 RepID=UPI000BE84D02|nr:nucleoside diphosphate kinase regulator [Sinorhizobium sp. BJ1]PDT81506.1 nucleoside diphosphate kinase regulator [Sinorhizobium sp. BJ1]